jgi:ribosomal-protein-alanine N-acetyltransferase
VTLEAAAERAPGAESAASLRAALSPMAPRHSSPAPAAGLCYDCGPMNRVTPISELVGSFQEAADGFAIVPSTWRDIRAVHGLERSCFARDAWGYGELIFMYASFGGVRLKAVADGRLVGFISGEPRPAEGFAWISTIGVHPDYRRQGVGSRLLAECEARLDEPRLRLTVRAGNTAAIALYQRFGYQEVERWPGYYADGETGIVMEKARG